MRNCSVSLSVRRWSLAAIVFSLLPLSLAAKSTEHVIDAFAGRPDCDLPTAPLISDAKGNLYGTTLGGGANNLGCIFQIAREGSGWKETVLYSFSGVDGSYPDASLVLDKFGNLYGTGSSGGLYNLGVAFELSPGSDGSWTETTVYHFDESNSGHYSELVFDAQGNLYGATQSGGAYQGGTVFELTPSASGWTETVLYNFPNSLSGPDGWGPAGGVVLDSSGNLYGNTAYGGVNGLGAVYELTPSQGGYKEQVLFSFDTLAGLNPSSTPVLGADGNLYGTTSAGGDLVNCLYVGCGTIYELKRNSSGKWTEKVLYALGGTTGASAVGPVAFDREGNLYAAAQSGGLSIGDGSVFKLAPTATGPWKETILHLFNYQYPNGLDGQAPYAGVIVRNGKVFGTTASGGGPTDSGTVYEVILK